jgi:HD-like signal output (HDOD) protein
MNQDKSFIEIVDTHLASSNARLPVFNTTALRIQQEIAKDESDLQVIEKLIVSDQALTAKVLSISNSSFYKGLQQVSTVRNAIVRVGINEVSNIVMLITHESNFRSKDPFVQGIMRKLWRHSVACAMGSNWLAKQCGLHSLAHEAFFAGLLHDVGMLFILTVIDDLKHSNEIEIQLSDALLVEAMNTLHTHHGHSLMSHWNLPEKYSQIARDHHQEEFDENNLLLALVRLADMACCKLGIGLDEDPSIVLIASPEAETLHISEVDLARMEIMLEDSQVFEGGG